MADNPGCYTCARAIALEKTHFEEFIYSEIFKVGSVSDRKGTQRVIRKGQCGSSRQQNNREQKSGIIYTVLQLKVKFKTETTSS